MIATTAAQLRMTSAIVRQRPVPRWAVRSLVAGTVATARQRTLAPTSPERLVSDGAVAFADLAPNRFERHVRMARQTSPWLADHLPPWTDRERLPTFDEVPVMGRDNLVADGGALVAPGSSPAVVATTTGTTGRPASVWFSDDEVDLMVAMSVQSFIAAGHLGDEDVIVVTTPPGIGRTVVERSAAAVGAVVATPAPDPYRLVDYLAAPVDVPGHANRPTVLLALASMLEAVIEAARAAGATPSDFGLRRIITGGEVVTAGLLERARLVFGDAVEVSDSYGATEIAPVAGMMCDAGHLHFSPITGLVEARSLTGNRHAEPGQLATLVVTPFAPFRTTTPLVRYDTGDIVTALAEPTDCSLAGSFATSPVHGKRGDLHRLGDRLVTTRDVLTAIEAVHGDLARARYAIDGGIEIAIVGDPGDAVRVAAALAEPGFGLDVTAVVDGLELDRWAAARGIRPYRPRFDSCTLAAAPAGGGAR